MQINKKTFLLKEKPQVVDKLYILKIYKTNLKKVVERFLLLGDFW